MNITIDIIILFLPIVIVQIMLAIYCVNKIVKEGVENLNKPLWCLICIFVNLIGPISFLIIGRRNEFR